MAPKQPRHERQLSTGTWIPSTKRARAPTQENAGLYGMGFLFEEPNSTGSRPRDLIGLLKNRKATQAGCENASDRRENVGLH